MKRSMIAKHGKCALAARRGAAGRIVIVMLVTALVFTFTFGSFAQTSQEQLDDVQAQQEEAEAKKEEILTQLEDAQSKVDDINAKVASAQEEIDAKESEIEELNKQIEENQKSIDDREEGIASRLRVMYKNGSASFLDILLSSRNVSEFLSNIDLLQRIYLSDKSILDELEQTQAEITKSRDELQTAQDELVAAQNELKAQQAEAEAAQAELETAESEVQAQIDAFEAEAESLSEQIRQEQEAAAAAAAAAEEESSSSSDTSGTTEISSTGFIWPCSGIITSYFGYRDDVAEYGYGYWHGGLDIAVPTGTPIVAAADGVVMNMTGNNYSYGYVVFINHLNGYSTVYGHNSQLLVSPGDTVKQGQVIAYSGSTGWSTGPHCHFEVRINGERQDPLNYLP
ncbi:MAG: murein hydrolase activator EnvC family protein [Eubacterium sp.]